MNERLSHAEHMTEVIEHMPGTSINQVIIHKNTGAVIITSSTKSHLPENISDVDTEVQLTGGTAQVVMEGKTYRLSKGKSLLIPAHSRYQFRFVKYCRLLRTLIHKHADEEIACV